MKIWQKILITVGSVFLLTTSVAASEGTADIRNVAGGSARCWAASVLMRDFNYSIILSCRDLVYPISSETFTYTIWVREAGSGNPIPLGDVGIGKRQFSLDKAFTSYFVTEERTSGPRQPSDRIVMEGQVQPISILVSGQSPTQQPDTSPDLGPFGGTGTTATPTPTTNTNQTTSSAFSALRIVGGVAVLAILLVVVIALISASRRRPIDL